MGAGCAIFKHMTGVGGMASLKDSDRACLTKEGVILADSIKFSLKDHDQDHNSRTCQPAAVDHA